MKKKEKVYRKSYMEIEKKRKSSQLSRKVNMWKINRKNTDRRNIYKTRYGNKKGKRQPIKTYKL